MRQRCVRRGFAAHSLIAILAGFELTPRKSTRNIGVNSFVWLVRKCLPMTHPRGPLRWRPLLILRIKAASCYRSLKKRWLASMVISGEWFPCPDDVVRPVIRGEVLSG